MTHKPVDTQTSQTDQVYQQQIDQANTEKKQHLDRITYIRKGCKTQDCWVTGGKAYWKGHLTRFGKNEIRAIEAKAAEKDKEISTIRNAWNQQRGQQVEAHQKRTRPL